MLFDETATGAVVMIQFVNLLICRSERVGGGSYAFNGADYFSYCCGDILDI